MGRKPTNTTEETQRNPMGFLLDAMVGGSSHAIEAQEARGQRELVNSDVLPTEMFGNAKSILESWGFTFYEPVAGDDLFVEVVMPTGWKKVSTDHAMWSNLVDDKGRKRGGIFYKAAFYDRKAHLSLDRRYSVHADYERQRQGVAVAFVKDGEDIIYTTEPIQLPSEHTLEFYNTADQATAAARAWVGERFPDWEKVEAYWD